MSDGEPLSPFDPRFGAVAPPEVGIFDAPTAQICVNVKWAAFLDGVIGKLLRHGVWQGGPAQQAWAVGEIQKLLIQLMQRNPCALEPEAIMSEISIWANSVFVGAGNPISVLANTSQIYNMIAQQSPATNFQSAGAWRYLTAGEYQYRYHYIRSNGAGIQRINVGSPSGTITTLATIDHYVAGGATLFNQVATGTFTVAETGRQRFWFDTMNKNAASGGYNIFWTLLQMWREAD